MSMPSPKSDVALADTAVDTAVTLARAGDVLARVTSTDPWNPAATVGVAIAARLGGNLTGCFVEPSTRMSRDDGAGGSTVLGLLAEPVCLNGVTGDRRNGFIQATGNRGSHCRNSSVGTNFPCLQ